MMEFTSFLILAAFIEFVIEHYVKPFIPEKNYRFIPFISSIIGVIACVIFREDIFAKFGIIAHYSIAGQVFSGLVAAQGAKGVHEIQKYLSAGADTREAEAKIAEHEVKLDKEDDTLS
jgi:hypothetical protein